MGLEEPKERSSKLMGIMWCRKVRMGHGRAKVMNYESKGLVESPWTPMMKDMVIRSGKPKRVSRSPWECRIRKWADDAQGERNGSNKPTSNVMGQENPR